MIKLKYLVYPGGFLLGMGAQMGNWWILVLGMILSIISFYYHFKK